jgi:type IV secretion system protein VirB9
MKKCLILILLSVLISPLLAAELPIDKSTDRRVKTVIYHPDQVYEITTAFGVASTIAFSEQEEVVGVSLGDPTVWQIVPIGNTLNIKPIGLNPDTNLTVWTTQRLYLFHLKTLDPVIENNQIKKASSNQNLLYLLKFIYNDKKDFIDPVNLNRNNSFMPHCVNELYSIYGNKKISPHFVCDDGEFTYLQFAQYQERPAIFMVDEHGHEHALNTRQEDDYHVITRLGAQFTLRHGELTSSLFNEAPPEFYL